MKKIVPILLLLAGGLAHSRVSLPHDVFVYRGKVGKAPVELAVNMIYKDSQSVDGVYMYTKHNEPIPLLGAYVRSKLELAEAGGHRFVFDGFSDSVDSVAGRWINSKTQAVLPVVLKKQGIDVGVLQKQSLKKYFFRVSRNSRKPFQKVEAYEKKTGRLFAKATAADAYGMDEIIVDTKDKSGLGFSVRKPNLDDILFGYSVNPEGYLLRTCCESSTEDSLDILYPNRFRNEDVDQGEDPNN